MADHAVLQECSSGELHELNVTKFMVGRSPSATLPVLDHSCDRKHFQVVQVRGEYFIDPLSITATTIVNGRSISQRESLAHGSEILAGDSKFVFLLDEQGAQHTSATAKASSGSVDDLAPSSPPMHDRTMIADAGFHESLAIGNRIAVSERLILGRDMQSADVHLPHRQVSRRHAELQRHADQVSIKDLGSANGTFVNGTRICTATPIISGDRIDVGPYSLVFQEGYLTSESCENNVQLVCEHLSQEVVDRTTGAPLTLLDDVTLIVRPQEFVCILGPSGSGKSTLLSAMSARTRATRGRVLLNHVDLHDQFELLKHSLAVVPQKDVLHEHLTVSEALRFSAKLRLPPDSDGEEIEQVVGDMLRTVGLEERRDTAIRHLSGGQIKRASLANEIVSQPSLLFLDEVTSGLDEQTDREMMQLFRDLASGGKTVVCITHSLANVERTCNLVVILTERGKLAFVGNPAEAITYFQISRLGDVYQKLAERSPDDWQQSFRQSPYYRRYIDDRSVYQRTSDADELTPTTKSWQDSLPEVKRQFLLVLKRYLIVQFADRRTLAMMAGQSLLVAFLLSLLFGDLSNLSLPVKTDYSCKLFFLMSISCIWFGCNNAAKEVVKERDIFQREHAVNLNLVSYLASKWALLSALTLVQTVFLLVCVRLVCQLPGNLLGHGLVLAASSVAGVSIGLLISAIAKTEDLAVTLVPILLIPQIILAGVIAPLDGLSKLLAQLTVSSFSSYRGMTSLLPSDLASMAQSNKHSTCFAFAILCTHILVPLVIAAVVLYIQGCRHDPYRQTLQCIQDRTNRVRSRTFDLHRLVRKMLTASNSTEDDLHRQRV